MRSHESNDLAQLLESIVCHANTLDEARTMTTILARTLRHSAQCITPIDIGYIVRNQWRESKLWPKEIT